MLLCGAWKHHLLLVRPQDHRVLRTGCSICLLSHFYFPLYYDAFFSFPVGAYLHVTTAFSLSLTLLTFICVEPCWLSHTTLCVFGVHRNLNDDDWLPPISRRIKDMFTPIHSVSKTKKVVDISTKTKTFQSCTILSVGCNLTVSLMQ